MSVLMLVIWSVCAFTFFNFVWGVVSYFIERKEV